MKKKYFFNFVLMLMFLLITACSNSVDEDVIRAGSVVRKFQKALFTNDEKLLEETVVEEVKVTFMEGENSGSMNFTSGEMLNDFKRNSFANIAHLFYNLQDKNISKINEETVVVYGNLYSFYLTNFVYCSMIHNLSETGFDGRYFSIDYPDNWMTLSTYNYGETNNDSVYEYFLGFVPEKLLTIFGYSDNSFELETGSLFLYVSNIVEGMNFVNEEFPQINNFVYTLSNITIDGYEAMELDFSYEQELIDINDKKYYPLKVEIKLEQENDNFYITEIKESRQPGDVETINIRNKMYFIRKDEKLYVVSYGGKKEDFNEIEFAEIIDSYEILQ
ncbi:MAG: hypothetical protein ACOCQW_06140 [Halanaerobiaceae bacterium]